MPSTIEGQQAFDPIPERDAVRRPRRAPAVGVGADGDDHGNRDDPAVLADLQVGGVNPDVGPIPFNRTIEKRADAFVDILAKPGDLALRDAGHAIEGQEAFDPISEGDRASRPWRERPGGLRSDLRRRQGQQALEGALTRSSTERVEMP